MSNTWKQNIEVLDNVYMGVLATREAQQQYKHDSKIHRGDTNEWEDMGTIGFLEFLL